MYVHKIKNISANNEAMLLNLGRDVALYKIYQMVYILMLLWQHALFQSLHGHNIQLKMLKRQPNEGGTGIHLR